MPNPPGISNLTEPAPHLRADRRQRPLVPEDPAAHAARGQAGLLARFEREAREPNPG